MGFTALNSEKKDIKPSLFIMVFKFCIPMVWVRKERKLVLEFDSEITCLTESWMNHWLCISAIRTWTIKSEVTERRIRKERAKLVREQRLMTDVKLQEWMFCVILSRSSKATCPASHLPTKPNEMCSRDDPCPEFQGNKVSGSSHVSCVFTADVSVVATRTVSYTQLYLIT
jgi:hypothetical protein